MLKLHKNLTYASIFQENVNRGDAINFFIYKSFFARQ